MEIIKLNRRKFLKGSTLAVSSGLLIGTTGCNFGKPDPGPLMGKKGIFTPDVFLTITSDGRVAIVCHRSEMGQQVRTSIPALIAEELDYPLERVEVVQATGDKKYGDQNTDGSRSIRYNYDRLRELGAAARQMLLNAAAVQWKVESKECYTQKGYVVHRSSNLSVSYGNLALAASQLEVPKEVKLKDPKNFKYIGKRLPCVDANALTTGTAVFGMDVQVPGMLYGAIVRSPTVTGKVESYDAAKAIARKGITRVFKINSLPQSYNTNNGVAIIGKNTWEVFRAKEDIKVQWSGGDKTTNSEYRAKMKAALQGPSIEVKKMGSKSSEEVKQMHEATFYTPFLVHAPMEPLVATAWVKNDRCDIWAPTQDPQRVRSSVASYLKIPLDKVQVNVTMVGGGFGRKSQVDFVLEAVQCSQKVEAPVKLVWTREDEIQHGFYHAASMQKIKAELNEQGKMLSWQHKTVFPTLMTVFKEGADQPAGLELGMAFDKIPFNVPLIQLQTAKLDCPVRVGWLRAVCNIYHSLAINCFADELAQKLNKDPIDYQLELIGSGRKIEEQDTSRLINVINSVRAFSDWNNSTKAGKIMGIGSQYNFGSYVAAVAEVENMEGDARVNHVWVTLDCGRYVNKDAVEAQMQGSVNFAYSIVKYGAITLDQGAVAQSNYHDYQVVRMDESPKISVQILDNDYKPEGVGEPAVPPIVSAMVNAFSRASGKRIYELPLQPS